MPVVSLCLIVLASDAIIVYLNVKERDAWATGSIHRSMWIEAATALAVCINVILVSEIRWLLVPFSVAGALAGRWAAWKY